MNKINLVIYHELTFTIGGGRPQVFISKIFQEIKLKTSEVLDVGENVSIQLVNRTGTNEEFLSELKKATQCL